jgi:hypothetical protein
MKNIGKLKIPKVTSSKFSSLESHQFVGMKPKLKWNILIICLNDIVLEGNYTVEENQP